MRHFFLTVVSLFVLLIATAQVAISTDGSAPHASAMLEVKSTNRGFLLPRLPNRTNIPSPTTGLMIYETASNAIWVYNGTSWVQMGSGGPSEWLLSGTHLYNGNSGNIGIGTSEPEERLEVIGNIKMNGSMPFLKLEASAGGTGSPIISNRYVPGLQFLRRGSTTVLGKMEYVDTTGTSDFLRFYTGPISSNDLTISADHQVGIGASDPNAKLEVRGVGEVLRLHSAFDPLLQFTTGSAGGSGIQLPLVRKGFLDINGNDFRIGTNAENNAGNFIVRVNGLNTLNVTPTGNVGVGGLPESRFHITTGSDASLTANGYLMLGAATGSNIVIDNNEILARTNGAVSALVLQHDGGTVRIGNVAVPTGYKFGVNGKMICEELKVKLASSGWPDYVFDKQYKLRNLHQLEAYIATNKHLPNIPSAAQVEKHGLEVGDMQKRMMEKIEELTLYVIDLQKQIDDLKKSK